MLATTGIAQVLHLDPNMPTTTSACKDFSSFTRLNHSPCCALLLPKTRSCADHGKLASVSIFGYNSRLSDLKRQALVVLVAYWDEWTRIDCETDPLPAQPQWNVDRLSGPLRCYPYIADSTCKYAWSLLRRDRPTTSYNTATATRYSVTHHAKIGGSLATQVIDDSVKA